jgi:hypothetical protein
LTEQIKRAVNIVIDDIDRRIRERASKVNGAYGLNSDYAKGLYDACDIVTKVKKEINE